MNLDDDKTTAIHEPKPEPVEPAPRPPRRRLGWLGWLAGSMLALVLLLAVALIALLGTQTGLRAAIAVAERVAPDVLSVGRLEGHLLGRLALTDVSVRLPTLGLRLGALELDWSPGSLFSGRVAVQRLALRDLEVALAPTADEDDEPFTLPAIVLPVAIAIDEARLERLRILELGAQEPLFALERAALSATLDGGALRLARLEARLAAPVLAAKASGQATLVGDYPLDLALDWELELPPGARLIGAARLSGDLRHLGVRHGVQGSVEADLDVHVQDVLARPSWEGWIKVERVDLPAFQPDWPQVATSARLETRGSLDEASLVGTLDAKAPDLPDFGYLAIALDLLWKERRLTIRALEMNEQVSQADLRLAGELDLAEQPGRFALEGDWKRLRWPLSGDLLAQSEQGLLKASGSLESFVYSLSGEVAGPSFPSAGVELKGQGTGTGTRLESLVLATLDGRLEGEGDLTWSPALVWDLSLRGQDLNPGRFVAGLDDRLTLSLGTQGGLDAFEYALDATSSGPGLPPSSLSLSGKGDPRRIELDPLRLETLNGRIEGRATLDLVPQLGWETVLTLTGIDPGVQAPDWPGRIDGRLTSQGRLVESGPVLTAVIEQLQGRLRGYPIQAAGKLVMEGGVTRIEGLNASSGPSRARIEGRVDQALDLVFALESSDLASLLPEAKGRIDASGRVGGTPQSPRVDLSLKADQVALAGNGIAALAGTADLDLAPNGRLAFRLEGKDLTAGSMRWGALDLRGEGRVAEHRLTVALTGEPVTLELAASGGLTETGGYSGRLATLALASKELGTWSLQRPMPLTLDGTRIAAGPLCLRQTQGSGGCLGFEQGEPGRWSADLDLDRLDFALLKGFLPETLSAEGAVQVKGRFQANGSALIGSASAEIPQGRVSFDLGRGKREDLDFSNTRLTLDAAAGGLSARLAFPVADLGRVDGDLSLPGWRLDAPARPDQTMRGRLRADVAKLERLGRLVPDITGLVGRFESDLAVAGTLGRPDVTGRLALREAGFQVPLIALQVKDTDISAEAATPERFDIRGVASLGGGKLNLTGDGRTGGQGLAARLRIEGDRLKLADTKEYFVRLSPQIEVEASSAGAVVRGEIRVPEARIRPRSVPAGTVSPSSDVVLKSSEPGTPFPVKIDLRLLLGDEVTIDSFGVRGRLAGSLNVLQEPAREMLGDGQLQITEGEYRLSSGFGIAAELGPPLTITQGRLIYAKSPIGNPGLLLQAERQGGDTTAGVRVVGTLRAPKMTFFSDSDPGLTQADITKYLMTGIPPSANDRADKAGLAVGTYIAPKIYMEYESGLGGDANKVKLRYDLSKHIELQTETGDSQGADIFFKFEN